MKFIDLETQYTCLRADIAEAIQRVLDHGQYIMGPEVSQLEEALCEYTGANECITVASGTEALLISLMALGIGSGDEVITTPFTFASTAEVIALVGASPVFVDIEQDTCNLNAEAIDKEVTPRTRAIIPVSLYGQPCDMDKIKTVAERHSLWVIEDGAQSFGSSYRGRRSGNLSDLSCTSFFPSKPLGCYGDGGAIFTSDSALAQACREIRIHGQSRRYMHTRIGVAGRMDTIQCAIVLAKLRRFGWEVEARNQIGGRYNELLDRAGIRRVTQREDRSSVFAQYTIFVENRCSVQSSLSEAGIPTAIHYPLPLNRQVAYTHCGRSAATPISDRAAELVISLPMHADLTRAQQDEVVAALICAAPRKTTQSDSEYG